MRRNIYFLFNFFNLLFRAGQEITLECESYGGNPLASLEWYKNGDKVIYLKIFCFYNIFVYSCLD